MNKFQREKAKRRKELLRLGIYEHAQRRLFRECKQDLKEVDQAIKGIKKFKHILQKNTEIAHEMGKALKKWVEKINTNVSSKKK